MGKRIVISFPGARGCEIPLLYFGAKFFEDQGYEKLFLNHPIGEMDNLSLYIEQVYENAAKVIGKMDFQEYEHVVFVAKSLGTAVACRIKECYQIPASLILFTPLEETMPYIHRENDILLTAMGDRDRYLPASVLRERCEQENINYYIEPGVGHRMEVVKDLRRNLEILQNVLGRLEGGSR